MTYLGCKVSFGLRTDRISPKSSQVPYEGPRVAPGGRDAQPWGAAERPRGAASGGARVVRPPCA
eukprot:799121-Pyramimonas_sp.AAC.1